MKFCNLYLVPVFRILLVSGTDLDPDLDLDPSIIKQKYYEKL
jgi:hypothetical protein